MAVLDVVILLFFFIIPTGIMLVFVSKLSADAKKEADGCNNFLLLLSSIIIFPLVIYIGSTLSPAIPKSLAFILGLTVFLLHAGIYLGKINSAMRLKKEDILLDLGSGESRIYLLFGLFIFILFAPSVYFLLQDKLNPETLILGVMLLPFCLRTYPKIAKSHKI